VRPLRNIFYKLSRKEQRREGVAAYLWHSHCNSPAQNILTDGEKKRIP